MKRGRESVAVVWHFCRDRGSTRKHRNRLKYLDLPEICAAILAAPVKRKGWGQEVVSGPGGAIVAPRFWLQGRGRTDRGLALRYPAQHGGKSGPIVTFAFRFWQTCLRMLRSKDNEQILVSSGVLDLTFASRSRA